MLTHKHIGKICLGVLVLCFLITAIFMNGEYFGITQAESTNTYQEKLFSELDIHTIDIIVDTDTWNDMLDNASEKEYTTCNLIIDGEYYTNIAIRTKGNSSLQQVQSSGSDRYSFKIEFDHYDNTKTYYGLDKLCLNNIVQDNTYMKDYLAYELMNEFGVASPLTNYVSVSVNGETFGLYLAVEAIEDAFLQRNYGTQYGTLYKPETSSGDVGGGNTGTTDRTQEMPDLEGGMESMPGAMGQMGGMQGMTGTMPGMTTDATQEMPDLEGGMESMPGAMGQMGGMQDMTGQTGREMPEMTDTQGTEAMSGQTGREMPEMTQDIQGTEAVTEQTDREVPEMTEDAPTESGQSSREISSGMSNQRSSGMGMSGGSSGLSSAFGYDGDDPDSYSYIFDNGVTDIDSIDQSRLIASIAQLNEQENLEEVVDVEQLIRYFIVHNFLLNFDSYTGSIMHNYYLYEEDGVMTMLPWDYNLSFVAFQTSYSTEAMINYPIDTPVSGNTVEDRPMLAWIFSDETYTELYHTLFAEFIEDYFLSGYFEEKVNAVESLIAQEVEDDPSKFCTYEQFVQGVDTLKAFVALRVESIQGQLAGTIGSTDEAQAANPEALISAGDVDVTDTGSESVQTGKGNIQSPTRSQGQPSGGGQMGGGMSGGGQMSGGQMSGGQMSSGGGQMQMPQMLDLDATFSGVSQTVGLSETQLLMITSGLVLLIGLLVAGRYRRRNH